MSVNLLSTTKIRLYHDTKTGRATLHPAPIVHQPGSETLVANHQQPLETPSHKSPKVGGYAITSSEGSALQSYADGDIQAREWLAIYYLTPAGISELAQAAALETKWAHVTQATAWKHSNRTSPSAAATAEALLKSLGF